MANTYRFDPEADGEYADTRARRVADRAFRRTRRAARQAGIETAEGAGYEQRDQ